MGKNDIQNKLHSLIHLSMIKPEVEVDSALQTPEIVNTVLTWTSERSEAARLQKLELADFCSSNDVMDSASVHDLSLSTPISAVSAVGDISTPVSVVEDISTSVAAITNIPTTIATAKDMHSGCHDNCITPQNLFTHPPVTGDMHHPSNSVSFSAYSCGRPGRKRSINLSLTPLEEQRQRIKRERNKIAATKCRTKKKIQTQRLFQNAHDLWTTHNNLCREIPHLINRYNYLRSILESHIDGCRQSSMMIEKCKRLIRQQVNSRLPSSCTISPLTRIPSSAFSDPVKRSNYHQFTDSTISSLPTPTTLSSITPHPQSHFFILPSQNSMAVQPSDCVSMVTPMTLFDHKIEPDYSLAMCPTEVSYAPI